MVEEEGAVTKTDVASSVDDIEVLMASYVEDNTSQCKNLILDSGITIYLCSQKELFNSLVVKEKGIMKMMVDTRLARSLALRQSRLQKEMGRCVLWKWSGMSRRHDTI